MNSFALLSANGIVRELRMAEDATPGPADLIWEHIEQSEGIDIGVSLGGKEIPDVVLGALVASETRPRCDQVEDGALINLRGPASVPAPDGDSLVSLRAWVHENRVLTVSRRTLAATRIVAAAMRAREIADPGDLVAAFSKAISSGLDPEVASLGDQVDDCESELEAGNVYQLRRKIALIRSEAIAYRRFVAPNRDALLSMAGLKVPWLADDDRLHIREAADRFARMAEELESVRERAALLHEQLTDLRSELIDQRSLMIAVVAFIFLPLTFITGLLGMNVTGIPFAHQPWAFWGVVAFCVAVGLVVLGWFSLRHWLGR